MGSPQINPKDQQKALGQYPTPLWVAEALVARHSPDLDAQNLVPVLVLILVPKVSQKARQITGRTVLKGDFTQLALVDIRPTAINGNPLFQMALVDRFLA